MGVSDGQLPPTASNRDEAAFDAGWLLAARWAERDDLHCDMDSPAYQRDRAALLAALPHMQPAGEAVAWKCEWIEDGEVTWAQFHDASNPMPEKWDCPPDRITAYTTPPQPSAEPQQEAESDECPNCVSPWKCNGPHIGLAPKHGYGDEDPQQEAQGAVAFEQPKAIELAVAAYLAAQEEGDSLYACVSEACAAYAQTTPPAPVDVRDLRLLVTDMQRSARQMHDSWTIDPAAVRTWAMRVERYLALLSAQPSADAGVDRTTGVKP